MTTVCTIGDEVRAHCSDCVERIGNVLFIGQIESQHGIQYCIKSITDKYHHYVKKDNILEVLKKATTLRVTVGDLVYINKKNCRAMVRFIGYTRFGPNPKTDIWYGVQLEKQKGKNDGSINGKRYFHCLPKYGLFVKAPQITPDYHISSDIYNNKQYDAHEVQIVMILQKWLRCCSGFDYDVGNKYHTISSAGIVKMIKSFALHQYDTVSATTQSFFKLNDLKPWQRLFKSIKGVSYAFIFTTNVDLNLKTAVVMELYLNDKRECKWIQKGHIGTWNILEEKGIIHIKFNKGKSEDTELSKLYDMHMTLDFFDNMDTSYIYDL